MSSNEAIIAGLAIFLGMLVVLIPIAGLTARFALKPMMEAFGRYREVAGENQAQQLLERRVSLMEEQLHAIDRSLRDLTDESEFRRQLEQPAAPALAAPRAAEAAAPPPREALPEER
jgi:hypothetical protein